MPDTVKNPVSDVYKRWSAEVKKVVGDGNYSSKEVKLLQLTKRCMHKCFLWEIRGHVGI